MSSVKKGTLKKMLQMRELSLLIIIVLMVIILSQLTPNFLQISNFRSLAKGFALEGITLIGMAMLLVSGVFDISVGSIMALSGVICSMLINSGFSLFLSILLGIFVGVITGLINGLIITTFKVNAFIVTFGTMSITRGVALAITQAQPIRVFDEGFKEIGRGEFLGIPVAFVLLLILVLIFDFGMRNIRFFRQLYFIGGNETSSELTGINVKKMKIISFIITGILASISGILTSSRLSGAVPTVFQGIELKLIVAAVIGGCTLDGGEGSISGSMLGLLFLFLLSNGMNLLKVSMYWENFLLGLFLVIVVLMNMWSSKKKRIESTM